MMMDEAELAERKKIVTEYYKNDLKKTWRKMLVAKCYKLITGLKALTIWHGTSNTGTLFAINFRILKTINSTIQPTKHRIAGGTARFTSNSKRSDSK